MAIIKVLSEDIINLIAAGEVIERPASVVKELVENSLDADATMIMVNLLDYGKKLIAVRDNGLGMNKEDAKNCLVRHATSKIKNAEDLFSITTLGFRGEALASIAAVSRLALTTRQAGMAEAFRLLAERDVLSTTVAAGEIGTTIEVRELFYNTPARKKFLKSDAVELRHMMDIVACYALANPQVAFSLTHNQDELLHTVATADLRNTIASLQGAAVAKDMLPIGYKNEAVEISGFIGTPAQVRQDKQQQIVFVNGRWVRSEEITTAVYEGYHSLLLVNKHPLFVLRLSLDPRGLDVNVHPAKTQIKMQQNKQVCQAVSAAVKETLQKHNLIPTVDVEFTPVPFSVAKLPKYAFEPAVQTILQVEETAPSYAVKKEAYLAETAKFPALKLLGQVHKTFFVAETLGGVFFIDQHAAHERVVYEGLMEAYLRQTIAVQELLQGAIIELSVVQGSAWKEYRNELAHLGFETDEFGKNSILLKTLPAVLGRLQPKDVFLELLAALQEGGNSLQEKQKIIITRMACRAAVMAGEVLTNGEMEKILMDLALKRNPYTCPHGRPVMIKTEAEELEKKFKRNSI